MSGFLYGDLVGDFVERMVREQAEALDEACDRALLLGVGVRCWRWMTPESACFEARPDPTVPAGLIYEHEHAPDAT